MRHLILAVIFVAAFSCNALAGLIIYDLGGFGSVEDDEGVKVGEYSVNGGKYGVVYHDEYGVGYLSNDGESGIVEFPDGKSESFEKEDVKAEQQAGEQEEE